MEKNLPTMQETCVRSLGWEDPLEKGMTAHSSILAWRILLTEECGRMESIGSQRVRHDWIGLACMQGKELGLPWWLNGKESACSAGDMGLIPGCWRFLGEGNGNPFQYCCLGNLVVYSAWGCKRVGGDLATKQQGKNKGWRNLELLLVVSVCR